MHGETRLKATRAALLAAALVIAASACGTATDETRSDIATAAGPANEVESAVEAAPAAADEAPTSPAGDATPADDTAASSAVGAPVEGSDAEPASPPEAPTGDSSVSEQAEADSARPPVERLSADVAIANAEANIDKLAPAQNDDNVLDIEVLAVGDGSIQTLRDVVVGDRPVLLWFFSPH